MLQTVISRPQRVRTTEAAAPCMNPMPDSLVRYIERCCFGRVHRLEVERHDSRLVLYGRTSTYYAKQLVQHAALEVAAGFEVENQIEVVRSAQHV